MEIAFIGERVGGGVIVTVTGNRAYMKIFSTWREALDWCDMHDPPIQVFNREPAEEIAKVRR